MKLWDRLCNRYLSSRKRESFALNTLDLKLARYLDFNRGFFIEAGGNNGVSQSNTLYFEKYQRWTGILIEPIPDLAAECIRNRPLCIVENCALVPFDFSEPEIEMHYCNLMSLVKGAMKSPEKDSAHVKLGCEVQRLETYDLRVPARTLTSILDQHSISRPIDLLSLDVEGFELSALKGLDFNRYRPQFMLIEARFREEIDAFLKFAYDPIAELSEHDVLYRNRG